LKVWERLGRRERQNGARDRNRTSDTRIFNQSINNNNQHDSGKYRVKPIIKDQSLNRSLSNLLEYSFQEKSRPDWTSERPKEENSTHKECYQNSDLPATEFNLIRLDRALCRLADEVAASFKPAGSPSVMRFRPLVLH